MPLDALIGERARLLAGYSFEEIVAGGPAVAAAQRDFFAPAPGYAAPDVRVVDRSAPGPHGDVGVRVYRRDDDDGGLGPGLVWLHGGGFRAGDLDMPEADAVARELCDRTRATVVSVGYRLVGDGVRFPVPHDDAFAAWQWAVREIGLDGRRLALGGASAGGNLAAGVALRLRDAGQAPAALLLAYPVLHRRLPPPASPMPADLDRLPPALRFPADAYARMFADYLGDAPPSPYAIPAQGAADGLPATLVLTSEYDDLRATAEAFARQLREAGLSVRERREAGAVHGHLNVPGCEPFRRSVDAMAAFLAAVG
jgi:acetyl esterase/lipase